MVQVMIVSMTVGENNQVEMHLPAREVKSVEGRSEGSQIVTLMDKPLFEYNQRAVGWSNGKHDTHTGTQTTSTNKI
jgi:hypothetical protein